MHIHGSSVEGYGHGNLRPIGMGAVLKYHHETLKYLVGHNTIRFLSLLVYTSIYLLLKKVNCLFTSSVFLLRV